MGARVDAETRSGLDFLDGGETGGLIRDRDWAETPLGPPETWPQSLCSALSICLHSSFPTAIYWGPELRLLYNDAWAPIPAERHPWSLGRPGAEVWADIWDVVGPQFGRVIETGEGFSTYDQMLPMVRGGVRRETYWNYSFTPIRGENGLVVGIFNQGHETTDRVLGERRGRFLLKLSDDLRSLSDPRAIIETAQEALGQFLHANRVGYGEVEETARYFTTERIWTDGSVPSREGTRDLAGFGPDVLASIRAGIPLLIRDAASDPRTSAPESLAAFDAIDTRAVITASLVKEGRMRAALYVHTREPRAWTEHDAEVVTEVAERIWAAVERARAEERLRESEARFRLIADAAPQIVWITDAWGRAEFFNKQWAAYVGTPDLPPTAADVAAAYVHPDDAASTMAAFEQARRTGVFQVEHRIRRKDGAYRWFLVRAEPYRNPATGEIVRWFGASVDIHDRRAAEAALRDSEARLSAVVESLPLGVGVVDLSGKIVFSNAEMNRFLPSGVIPSLGTARLPRWRAWHPDGRPMDPRDFPGARAIRGERVVPGVDMLYTDGDGREIWTNIATVPITDADGRVVGHVAAISDVDEIKRATEALRENEARLRELNETLEHRIEEALAERKVLVDIVEGTDAFVQVVDFEFRFLAINKAAAAEFEHIFGVRPKVGDSMLDLLADQPEHQAAVKAIWSRALAGEEFTEVGEFGDPRRARRFYEMKYNTLRGPDGERIGAYQFVYDVTEHMRDQARLAEAEAQLRQAQKMEAVGQLTGGVAHDFNNLLTIIKSSTDLLRRPGLPEERRGRYVDAISDTVDRASKLTGQLLAFARRQALKPEVFDAAERLQRITDMLRTIVGARVRIVSEVRCDRCFVEADLSQFETALVNMAVNARDAMDGEGTLTITVDAVTTMPRIRGHGGSAGRFVAVTIADTGHGIPADKLAQIFEPFYTTKDVGKGTGLGLSQVYGFAKQSGGDVAVESELGRGTRFTLYLPRIERESTSDDAASARNDEPAEHGRGRRVLVVEDNVEVGRFSTQILQDFGYETTWAANADEALRLLAEGNGFDVVFSDVVMPGMSGVELGREIRRRWPGLPVVLTSGYSHVLAEEGRHGFELIHKPYAAEDLSRVLRRATRRAWRG